MFLVNIAKFLRTRILKNIWERLLLEDRPKNKWQILNVSGFKNFQRTEIYTNPLLLSSGLQLSQLSCRQEFLINTLVQGKR